MLFLRSEALLCDEIIRSRFTLQRPSRRTPKKDFHTNYSIMRFCFVVLVAAVALFSSSNGVSANTVAKSEVEASESVRALAGQNDVDIERLLKYVEEDDGDRAIGGSAFAKLKDAVMKIKFSSWYKAEMSPTQVNKMLINRGGQVDWAVATAYAAYFRNLKYGPYAIDMINKKKNAENSA
ncbi:Avr1b-1 avirulence-like protein [Phytophthora cinnamomi]|uniref:Avr1b-1 avirulence-like protein n=1 Tax=Phytophthora cinnamomi TaxID=4785 RepID=UPI00355A1954|nr:Avr1b-1 avirulence-like protein [Phytophthora cinnamomi]